MATGGPPPALSRGCGQNPRPHRLTGVPSCIPERPLKAYFCPGGMGCLSVCGDSREDVINPPALRPLCQGQEGHSSPSIRAKVAEKAGGDRAVPGQRGLGTSRAGAEALSEGLHAEPSLV